MKGPLPPHAQLTDFLPSADHRALLEWVFESRTRFAPATIASGRAGEAQRFDAKERDALVLRDLGSLEHLLRDRLLAALPQVMAATGTKGPEPHSLELELTAYGDGAFYRPHIDIPVGPDRAPLGAGAGEDRIVSAVYYFHAEPRAFSGGELRLYRFGATADRNTPRSDFVDLEPRQNSLALFPSWVQHKVRTVRCPSGRFEDYRFALNCWYCRPLLMKGAGAPCECSG